MSQCRSCSRRSASRAVKRVRRRQDGSGWRQLTRHGSHSRLSHLGVPALGLDGEHAFRKYEEKADGRLEAAKERLEKLFIGPEQSAQSRPLPPASSRDFGQEGFRLWRRWSTWRRPTRRLKVVEEQQAPISKKFSIGAKQSVQTEPHLPVGCQDIGQEELFVFGDDKSREPQEAPGEGFGSLDRRETVPAKSVLEHLACPSASAPGRGTMPAKASLGASRVSVRERSWQGNCASKVVSRVRPRALGWPKPRPVRYGWSQAGSTLLWGKRPYALQRAGSRRRGSPRRCQKRTGGRLPSEVAWRVFKLPAS